MRCGTESHHGSFCNCGCHRHGCSCGCGGHGQFGRRFLTKEEEVAGLEEYLENLQKEVQAVQEHIAKLQEK